MSKLNKKYKELGIKINTARTGRYYKAGLLDNINEPFINQVQNYWKKHYGDTIDPGIHQAYLNLYGKKEMRLIPGSVMRSCLLPYFNDNRMGIAYRDKNLYDSLFQTEKSVQTILKRTRGNYYDKFNKKINEQDVISYLLDKEPEYIIKPSDTNNGLGIEKLVVSDSKLYLNDKIIRLSDIEEMYGFNFTIQKVIKQHELLAQPHPSSVNTLRMVTLRWKGDIHYLLTFARFGANNSVKDNAGTGGVCIGINEKGEFFDTAIDANACLHTIHPTTGYKFKSLTRIENFDTFKQFVIYLHHQVIHHDFISWDIAVDHNSEPVFIEANFAGATWLYQFASKQPLFGDLTEEILQTISPMKNKRYRNVQVRSKKRRRSSIKSLKNNLKKQRQEVITLKERNKKIKSNSRKLKLDLKSKNIKIKQLNEEIEKLKGEINQIKNSKSWRYTAIFRRKK